MVYRINDDCINCGACADECPVECISSERIGTILMRKYVFPVVIALRFVLLAHHRKYKKAFMLIKSMKAFL